MSLVKCRTLYNEVKYVEAESMIQRPSVYGVVIHNRRLLVGQAHSTKRYVLPGGGIERGELIEDALKREFREETGIDVAVREFLHFETHFFYYDPLETAYHGFLFFYRCEALTVDLVTPDYPPEEDLDMPLWVPVDGLSAEMFQSPGERTMRLVRMVAG